MPSDERERDRLAAVMAGVELPPLVELLVRPAWHADAACKEHPETSWFPERGNIGIAAKRVCSGCLVRAECAAFAESVPVVGIWAGVAVRTARNGATQPRVVPASTGTAA